MTWNRMEAIKAITGCQISFTEAFGMTELYPNLALCYLNNYQVSPLSYLVHCHLPHTCS
jgi:hypothetical protein